MLVMPDLKEEVIDKQKKIEQQKYQIKQLQKNLKVMFLRIKEMSEQPSYTK